MILGIAFFQLRCRKSRPQGVVSNPRCFYIDQCVVIDSQLQIQGLNARLWLLEERAKERRVHWKFLQDTIVEAVRTRCLTSFKSFKDIFNYKPTSKCNTNLVPKCLLFDSCYFADSVKKNKAWYTKHTWSVYLTFSFLSIATALGHVWPWWQVLVWHISDWKKLIQILVPKSETRGFDSWLTSNLRIEHNFPLATSDVQLMSETKFSS